jgi:hypothetical protein
MRHPSPWPCKSCAAVLGEVAPDGSLTIRGLEIRTDRRGPTRVVCPRCGAERPWLTGRERPNVGESLGKAT